MKFPFSNFCLFIEGCTLEGAETKIESVEGYFQATTTFDFQLSQIKLGFVFMVLTTVIGTF
jgi:hypothetical protein